MAFQWQDFMDSQIRDSPKENSLISSLTRFILIVDKVVVVVHEPKVIVQSLLNGHGGETDGILSDPHETYRKTNN